MAEVKPAGGAPAKARPQRDATKTLSPALFGFGSVPGTPDEARAHVQQRLRAYAGLCSVIWLIVALAQLLLRSSDPAIMRNAVHPVAIVVQFGCVALLSGVFALFKRRQMSLRALDLSDLIMTKVQVVALFVIVVAAGIPKFRTELVVMLGLTNLLAARAALVPCTVARTAALGLAATGFQPIATYWLYTTREVPDGFPSPISLALFVAVWGAVAVVLSSAVTRVIYGLEKRVKEASTLGQYTLEAPLGIGGMGMVYTAKHALLRRPTAIKLLPPEKAGRGAIKRFEREVQLTSQINHPNVVAIYDYGRSPDGVFYYAMEYLDGIDLDRLVARVGALPPARARHLLRQAAEALAEAHAINLIHRDVKPANIVVLNKGRQCDRVKVLDFGLVKDVAARNVDPSMSNIATLIGTPLYISPESITSPDKVDQRSDLYALGAVAYFLLTGAPFIKGKTMVEVCAAHMYEKPEPPSSRAPFEVPSSLDRIVLRCLEKDPAARPQSAIELLDLLEQAKDVPEWTLADAQAAWGQAPPSIPAPDELEGPTSRALPIDLRGR